jgi:16S rRNA (guanine527-N7)-methyltransferase
VPPSLPTHLELWQQTLGWQPNPAQQQQFQHLYELILTGNQQLNLTRITEPAEFWEKHLWDSLTGIQPWLVPGESPTLDALNLEVIDIGTGAGFPGLPVALACPSWQLTLLDSTRKKINFLEQAITTLGLTQVKAEWGRAEAYHLDWGGKFDLALVRAVADPATCAAYALPLLKPGGQAILYRGQWSEADAQDLSKALRQQARQGTGLSPVRAAGVLKQSHAWQTPLQASQRHCLVIERVE